MSGPLAIGAKRRVQKKRELTGAALGFPFQRGQCYHGFSRADFCRHFYRVRLILVCRTFYHSCNFDIAIAFSTVETVHFYDILLRCNIPKTIRTEHITNGEESGCGRERLAKRGEQQSARKKTRARHSFVRANMSTCPTRLASESRITKKIEGIEGLLVQSRTLHGSFWRQTSLLAKEEEGSWAGTERKTGYRPAAS